MISYNGSYILSNAEQSEIEKAISMMPEDLIFDEATTILVVDGEVKICWGENSGDILTSIATITGSTAEVISKIFQKEQHQRMTIKVFLFKYCIQVYKKFLKE